MEGIARSEGTVRYTVGPGVWRCTNRMGGGWVCYNH